MGRSAIVGFVNWYVILDVLLDMLRSIVTLCPSRLTGGIQSITADQTPRHRQRPMILRCP